MSTPGLPLDLLIATYAVLFGGEEGAAFGLTVLNGYAIRMAHERVDRRRIAESIIRRILAAGLRAREVATSGSPSYKRGA